jgi:hypothetical protein
MDRIGRHRLPANGCTCRDHDGVDQLYSIKAVIHNASSQTRLLNRELDREAATHRPSDRANVFRTNIGAIGKIMKCCVHIAYRAIFRQGALQLARFRDVVRDSAPVGGFAWGDVHHPAISKTNGDYDGRWLFVNDNANNRMARIDLRDFKTRQIFGPMPNVSGNHGSTFVTNNTEYWALRAFRFRCPRAPTHR